MADYPWVKIWVELLDDPKINTFTAIEERGWFRLLLLAGTTKKRGVIDEQVDYISLQECNRIVKLLRHKCDFFVTLLQLNLIENFTKVPFHCEIKNWDRFQYSEGYDRKQRFNERKKERAGNIEVTDRLKNPDIRSKIEDNKEPPNSLKGDIVPSKKPKDNTL